MDRATIKITIMQTQQFYISVIRAVFIACLVVISTAAISSSKTISAIDSGWYQSNGFHEPTNTNYIVGQFDKWRNFFVFEQPNTTSPIVSAVLRLECPPQGCSLLNPDFPPTYTVYDVSTPISELIAGGTGKYDIFTDLGTGASFGSVTIVERTLERSIITIELNTDAVNYLNGVTGQFAFGGTLSNFATIFSRTGPQICPNCIRELVLEVTVNVAIDIKPRKNPKNIIDLRKDKELKVAIVGSDTFLALQVDPTTVKFGPSKASPINFKGQDYNRDGFSDLILIFNRSETGIVCGVTEATLTGETVPDPVTSITGSDSFTVEPCN